MVGVICRRLTLTSDNKMLKSQVRRMNDGLYQYGSYVTKANVLEEVPLTGVDSSHSTATSVLGVIEVGKFPAFV